MKLRIPQVALSLMTLATVASGKTIMVDTQSDGGTPLDGMTTLREAIGGAAIGDTVSFAPALSGKTILLTEGHLTVSKSISISSPFLGLVSIAPHKLHPSRIFVVEEGVGLTLSSLEFSGGSSENDGGVIWNAGQITVNSCQFIENRAGERGGAIHNEGGGGDLELLFLFNKYGGAGRSGF